LALKNYINHVVLVIDASGSMYSLVNTVVKVVDDTVKHLAEESVRLEQETRVTVYTFSSGYNNIKCLAYDMDVLRMPSIAGMYKANGGTALIDATIKAIDDLSQTATLYGEHAFLMYVITDGDENSSTFNATSLTNKFQLVDSKGNWSYACFVPNHRGTQLAIKFGFPSENTVIWDTASAKGFESVGRSIQQASSTFMTNRSMGIRSSKNLFSLNRVTESDIKMSLNALTGGSYQLLAVPFDQRVDEFVYDRTGRKLIIGKAYYQLTKKETIQPQKNIAIGFGGKIYTGPQARQLIGLPDHTVDVDPTSTQYANYTIFVQSTALNRKLISGTSLLLLN
jgi:uncharacterized protein YegL